MNLCCWCFRQMSAYSSW